MSETAAEAIRFGEERYQAGAWAEAAAIFAGVAEQDPEDSTALRLLGLCRLRLGDPAGALALLERAYALAPADPFAQLHLGLGLHALGRNAEAAALFRRPKPGRSSTALARRRPSSLCWSCGAASC
jgi:Flp pilus assembly protein TadD